MVTVAVQLAPTAASPGSRWSHRTRWSRRRWRWGRVRSRVGDGVVVDVDGARHVLAVGGVEPDRAHAEFPVRIEGAGADQRVVVDGGRAGQRHGGEAVADLDAAAPSRPAPPGDTGHGSGLRRHRRRELAAARCRRVSVRVSDGRGRFTQYVFRRRRVVVTLVLAAAALAARPQVIMPDDRWPVAFPGIQGVTWRQACTRIKKCDPVSNS